ncbi:phosphoenolpyruvate synthase [soil metagenome]
MILTIDNLLKLSKFELSTVAGGKASNLVELMRHKLPVPPFYVIAPEILEQAYLRHWGRRFKDDIRESDLSERIRQAKQSSLLDLPDCLLSLTKPVTFAVRSSAKDEDGQRSFAGQLSSFLNVQADEVLEKVFQVFASAFERRALAYRKLNRLGESEIPSVIVQLMVPAASAGVIFSHDPVSLNDSQALVAITRGLADKLVDGAVDGSTLFINRKSRSCLPASELISKAALEQLLSLLEQCEEIFGGPQDIEFAIASEHVYLLQARAITTCKKSNDTTRVFDGSNIQESYPGITSPMTFSFIKSAYQEVYKSFCRLMGVSEKTIQAEGDLFGSMLSYIDGRVYYNLASWYRLLALLPAYKTNRKFMEDMMGLSQSASEVSSYDDEKSKESLLDYLHTAKAAACIATNYLQLGKQIKDFDSRLELALTHCDLESCSLDQLHTQYHNLQAKLLSNWQAPVTNDFFAMVSFGVLNKLAARNDVEDGQYVYNLLLQDHGGIISAAPPKIIAQIASLIASDKKLCQAMVARNQALSLDLLSAHREAYVLYLHYLEKFGDRSIGELKLEVKSVSDDPSILLNTIGSLALSLSSEKIKLVVPVEPITNNAGGSRPGNLIVNLAAKQTRQLLAQRENLRFARTRVFGRVRKIVVAMGGKLVEQKTIDCVDDVFFLTIDELLGYIDGTAVSTNLRSLIILRREESRNFASSVPERLVLVGAAALRQTSMLSVKPAEQSSLQLKGLGASAGVARGRARVIRNPETEMLEPGEILVADRTDPGWIVHFASCKAIVVAHGSLLSHTAIVARELAMPAVVSCKGVMETIETGDMIEVNGSTGEVVVLARSTAYEGNRNEISA